MEKQQFTTSFLKECNTHVISQVKEKAAGITSKHEEKEGRHCISQQIIWYVAQTCKHANAASSRKDICTNIWGVWLPRWQNFVWWKPIFSA